jgi:hypothetical protein
MRTAIACALIGAALPVHAARPMITDDARIVDARACQLETWGRRNGESTEYWALPACNPWGPAEIAFGGALTNAEGHTRFSDVTLQAKSLLKPYEPGTWGVGLAVGAIRHLQGDASRRWPGDLYAYVPFSIAAGSDDFVIHANAGAAHHRDERRTHATWGVGAEVRLTPQVYFIPETFSTDRGRPFFQAGFRWWLVPDRVQADATYGNRLVSESRERWFSVGIRLLSPPWFP